MRGVLRFLPALLAFGCAAKNPNSNESDRWFEHSNIQRSDYVGSTSCARCHQAIYGDFMQSPMHNMTRLLPNAVVHAPFDGHVFHFKRDEVVLEQKDGQRWMRIVSPEFGDHLFLITKIIGGRIREDFAGVEPGQADPHAERVLPVSYMIHTGRFRYKGYSVMDPERPGLKPGAVWNQTCIFCHNTEPYLSTILETLAGPGAAPYQGERVDALLPPEKRRPFVVDDSAGLRRALDAEIKYLRKAAWTDPGGSLSELAGTVEDATRARFNATDLIEIGIGCESCHGGCREHVAHPWQVKPSLAPRSPFLHVAMPEASPDSLRAERINRVCARCHQVLFSRYPWTWEGKRRYAPVPGGAHITSGEARDLLLSKCAVACTDCHDPHAHDDRPHMAALEGPSGNMVCLRCHSQFATPEALQAHSHHDPGGAGGICINCHMPLKNMSLDTRLTRYHRIGSPTDPDRVEGDRPLECALCHTDQSVTALVDTMELWWGHHYQRAALEKLYGNLQANVIEATLRRGKPHEKAVALYLIGQQHAKGLAPLVAHELVNPYPLVRYFADDALAELTGEASPLDLHQDDTAIVAAAVSWLKAAARDTSTAAPPGPADTASDSED